jgi:hypothetical protein
MLVGLMAAALPGSQTAEAATNSLLNAALGSVTAGELFEHVEVLSDDIYEGRAAGTRGGRAAAQYILKQLREYPLTPAGTDGEYVQVFDDDWRNILVFLPGDDPLLEQEIIVVGAHYDHVGYGTTQNSYGPTGRIHNGADDNASGVAMLLETIEAFATSGLRTRRSILFAFWDGEEQNLKGSRYWLDHPTLPRDRVKLAITIDMVGRLDDEQLFVLGTRSGYGLRRMMSGLVEDELSLDFNWDLSANSDHWSFLERKVPVVLLHTGLHRDYHRPSDDAEKINRLGMQDVSHFLLSMLIKVANADELPVFRPAFNVENSEARQLAAERPLPKVSLRHWPSGQARPKLGISWRFDEAEPNTVYLTRVVGGTPAAAAGLKVLDRIHEIDGRSFRDATEFEAIVQELLKTGTQQFPVQIERNGRVRTIVVRMAPS